MLVGWKYTYVRMLAIGEDFHRSLWSKVEFDLRVECSRAWASTLSCSSWNGAEFEFKPWQQPWIANTYTSMLLSSYESKGELYQTCNNSWVAYKWLISLITPLSTYKTPLGLIKLLDFDIGLAVSRWVGQFHVGLALSRWVGTFPLGGTCEHNAVLCEQQQQPERIIAESFNSLQFHKRWVEKNADGDALHCKTPLVFNNLFSLALIFVRIMRIGLQQTGLEL